MGWFCKLFGHKWNYGRCKICNQEHQNHKWEAIGGKCMEKCRVCGEVRHIPHQFSEESSCLYRCSTCGKEEERHCFVRQSPCIAVCSICGKVSEEHLWNPVTEQVLTNERDNRTGCCIRKEIKKDGCTCQKCGKQNPLGQHEFIRIWEGDFLITKCKHCGIISSKIDSQQAEAERFEAAVNADEGIVQ